MRLPTEAEIAEINARHLIETPLRPADLLFVFGTRADVSERVDEAFRLWREGYFRCAIVSGGVTAPVAETPLPAAFPLFATGLGALGLMTWRRKRKAVAS